MTAGKYAGQQGVVQSVDRKRNLVKIEGINLAKKNVASTKDRKGGIYPIEKGVHYSNVHVLDPSDGAPTRVAFRFLETGEKVRVSKRTGVVIPRPAILTLKDKHKGACQRKSAIHSRLRSCLMRFRCRWCQGHTTERRLGGHVSAVVIVDILHSHNTRRRHELSHGSCTVKQRRSSCRQTREDWAQIQSSWIDL